MRMFHWVPGLLILLAAVPSHATDETFLSGTVVDAFTGAPLSGAEVTIAGFGLPVTTDGFGRYRIEAPGGTWRLEVRAPGYRAAGLANQTASGNPRSGTAYLFPESVPEGFALEGAAFGIGQGTGLGPKPHGEARLPSSPLLAAVPASLPKTIKVARYHSGSCSGTYTSIDTLDFEDYVKGVVDAEIGVFGSVSGAPATATECFKTFAVAARSYALHFILTSPYANYDINDTACNQRYDDARDPDIDSAVDATCGLILVKASDHNVIDRYFYAASCGHHGTEPAYAQGTILPDDPDKLLPHACVGSWCGHDTCAGHADNPDVPGADKCLVWGTCQWGSIERSMGGQVFRDILTHYQPNCFIRDMNAIPDGGVDAGDDSGNDQEPAFDSGTDGADSGPGPADETTTDGGDGDGKTRGGGGCGCGGNAASSPMVLPLLLAIGILGRCRQPRKPPR